MGLVNKNLFWEEKKGFPYDSPRSGIVIKKYKKGCMLIKTRQMESEKCVVSDDSLWPILFWNVINPFWTNKRFWGRVGKVIHWKLCNKNGFQGAEKCFATKLKKYWRMRKLKHVSTNDFKQVNSKKVIDKIL